MSAGAQVALLGSAAPRRARPGERHEAGSAVTLTGLGAFGALALYATLRWSTMLGAPYAGRSFGLVVLAIAICLGAAATHDARPTVRLPALAFTALACVAMFPACGLPLHLLLHLRLAAIVRLIGHGLGSLPNVIVPYTGGSAATAFVIRLGAGMLLLGAALTVGTSRAPRGEARLAAAALPLIVLATIPSCLSRPQVAYLHGFILFVLLAVFVFSERLVRRPGAGTAIVLCTAVAAFAISPGIDRHRAWVDFESLAGGTSYGSAERFDWAQTYGPLDWPSGGTTVFDVEARLPSYWKAEDLDGFDGQGWVTSPAAVPAGAQLGGAGVTPANLARWTQDISVSLGGLRGSQLIAAGQSTAPDLPGGEVADAGGAADQWIAGGSLRAGETYSVRVYTPRPTPAELAAAGARYPAGLGSQLQMTLPGGPTVQFASYGQPLTASSANLLQSSPYARVLALSRRLARGRTTPYAYTQAVLSFLQTGFTYTTDPRQESLPLVAFLLHTHAGYCQQFAGAMALLMRMGGIPAHVSVGFETGTPTGRPGASGLQRYAVTDEEAHAWVEAWFPGIGWASFDPTPSVTPTSDVDGAPGTSDSGALAAGTDSTVAGHDLLLRHRGSSTAAGHVAAAGSAASSVGHHRPATRTGGIWPKLLLGVIVLVSLALGLSGRARRRQAQTPERLLLELERAFARTGRPLGGGVTLRTLEDRFAGAPAAVAYLRAVRAARFAGESLAPSRSDRRALRAELRRGLGPLGALRALIALPPRL